MTHDGTHGPVLTPDRMWTHLIPCSDSFAPSCRLLETLAAQQAPAGLF